MGVSLCQGGVDRVSFGLGEAAKAVLEGGLIHPELIGKLLRPARPQTGIDETIQRDEAPGRRISDLFLDCVGLAAAVSVLDVDELVREGTAAFGLELARGHPDAPAVGCAQDVRRECLSPDEGEVEALAEGCPGVPHAREDTRGHGHLVPEAFRSLPARR